MSFFFISTKEPAQLIIFSPQLHFWARSQHRDENACLCFINGWTSPRVLSVNQPPKWWSLGYADTKRGHWAALRRHLASSALSGRHWLAGRGKPCCSQSNYMLLAFKVGFAFFLFSATQWYSPFLALTWLSKCFQLLSWAQFSLPHLLLPISTSCFLLFFW